MAMRELVTGGAACAVPGSSSSSNPLGALANALVGSSSKTQDRLREIPTSSTTLSGGGVAQQPLVELPGSELDQPLSNAQGSEFLQGFHSAAQHDRLTEAWDEIQSPQGPYVQGRQNMPIPLGNLPPAELSAVAGPPQRVLSSFLHSFVNSGHEGIPFTAVSLPFLGLSQGDKQCIRDRSSIMARHIFADRSEEFVKEQVNALLSSLEIDGDIQARGHMPGRLREMEEYWNESQIMKPGSHPVDGWVAEYMRPAGPGDPNSWVQSFEQEHGPDSWVSEFGQEVSQASIGQMGPINVPSLPAMEQSRILSQILAQNEDPKFQNSKFLQFVSKMSRGEITVEDNQMKPAILHKEIPWVPPGDWAAEYQQQYGGGQAWADQFLNQELSRGPTGWVDEFSSEHNVNDQWVNEFANKLHVDDWAHEFEGQSAEGSADPWVDAYEEYLNEQDDITHRSGSSRGVYKFSELNPYVGHPNPLKQGQELFRKGLLSEAVLALEAEVLKNPGNAEGWRFLGLAQAENDDDQQAIAAMMSAQEADPTNLEVLLALGVSHTNELERAEALKYLYGWLRHHPKYGALASPDQPSDALYHADVTRLFIDAANMSPEDADVHIVLGVLFNLSREYDKAIESFQTALKLKPQDYSLWNKLGATQANSVQSAEAIKAYQQALDLKPNYVRAWANIGISYANQGMYEESIKYYVQAVSMNPNAANAWQYLKISLSCASRSDMMDACDSRNLDILQKEFPMG